MCSTVSPAQVRYHSCWSFVGRYFESGWYLATTLCNRAEIHAEAHRPFRSRSRHRRRMANARTLSRNRVGKSEAITRQISDENTVVMTAPSNPVLKKSCTPSGTLKILSPSPGTIFKEMILAMRKVHTVTSTWRPIRKACRLLPLNASRHILLAVE